MKRGYWVWYVLVAVAALAPAAAVRGLTLVRDFALKRELAKPVDRAMAKVGDELFNHEWTASEGLGPVFNATSCAACHFQGGIGGSGTLNENVTTFTVRDSKGHILREGVVHAESIANFPGETLSLVDAGLPPTSRPRLSDLIQVNRSGHCTQVVVVSRGTHVSQRNTPALFGSKLIDAIPESDILANARLQSVRWLGAPADGEEAPVGRVLRLANGQVGRFGWKAQAPSLGAFVQGACANELGLGNPGQAEPKPLSKGDYKPARLDLTQEQCDQLTAFCASLPRPTERADVAQEAPARAGKHLFASIGCADCHTPNLGSVEGLYSDLLLHRMGQDLEGGGSYNDPPAPPPSPDPDPNGPPGDGPSPGEWRTPPLWGVADSAPYMHDGRAPTLEEAIRLHGGQAARSARRFSALAPAQQAELVTFLKTLRAPEPEEPRR
jgi:CxxC motif-containing protein (DUF1111 family)